MKKRCIMIFPKFNNLHLIEEIREKYDPLFRHVAPHITLVFPFESNLETSHLREHIITKLKGIKPFHIRLKGIIPSVSTNGNYMFLNIEEGKEKIIEIHKKLYTEILEEYIPDWLKKVDYFPHMTIGNLESEYNLKMAIEDTKDFDYEFETMVEKISVEIIDINEDSIIELNLSLLK